jgi:chaperonin GroES
MEDQVAVQVLDVTESTKGGIVVPETAKQNQPFHKGKVVAVGPGRFQDGKQIPIDLVVGDVIYFGKRTGAEIEVESEKVVILRVSNIYAKETK